MKSGDKHKASTEEPEALCQFTSEQLMPLRDIVRILRLLPAQWKVLEQEFTADTSCGTFPDAQTGSAEIDRDRLKQRIGLGDGA